MASASSERSLTAATRAREDARLSVDPADCLARLLVLLERIADRVDKGNPEPSGFTQRLESSEETRNGPSPKHVA